VIDCDNADVIPLVMRVQPIEHPNAGRDEHGDVLHLAVTKAAGVESVQLDCVERLLKARAESAYSIYHMGQTEVRYVERQFPLEHREEL